MPFQSIDVRDGDPSIQTSGQHRGTVDAVFDDGVKMSLSIRANDADDWNDQVAGAAATLEARRTARDAQSAVDPETEVEANGYASKVQACVAYIRAAWEEETAIEAHRLYARINNYITANSDWLTVKPLLLAEGLTDDEFEQAKTAFQYLSGNGRPAIMAEALTIQANWESQH